MVSTSYSSAAVADSVQQTQLLASECVETVGLRVALVSNSRRSSRFDVRVFKSLAIPDTSAKLRRADSASGSTSTIFRQQTSHKHTNWTIPVTTTFQTSVLQKKPDFHLALHAEFRRRVSIFAIRLATLCEQASVTLAVCPARILVCGSLEAPTLRPSRLVPDRDRYLSFPAAKNHSPQHTTLFTAQSGVF